MTGNSVLVDTNVLIYLTSGNASVANLLRGRDLHVSFITEMEMRSWPRLSVQDLAVVKLLMSRCRVTGLSRLIKEEAIDIRKNFRLQLPDAIIAATARVLRRPLISADKTFGRVHDLRVDLVKPASS
jgi:predicted nucleic acid-binding protein